MSVKHSQRWRTWTTKVDILRNRSSDLEGLGHSEGFHTNLTLSEAQANIGMKSGSDSDNATFPEGSNVAESSSPETLCSPTDEAIDIWPSGGGLKDTVCTSHIFQHSPQ